MHEIETFMLKLCMVPFQINCNKKINNFLKSFKSFDLKSQNYEIKSLSYDLLNQNYDLEV